MFFQTPGSPKTMLIAELGTAHNGDIARAKEMVAAAAATGADCVKFQIVYADEILHPNTGEVTLPGGTIRLYDRFKQLETTPDFYAQIKEYAESQGILFLCTPFGPKSAAELRKLDPKMVKIASPELNYTALLREIATWNLPVLLSTGVSTLADIETAVKILGEDLTRRHGEHEGTKEDSRFAKRSPPSSLSDLVPLCLCENSSPEICLLHCVTAYPAPETDYNLRVLDSLSRIFGVPVGLSDHSLDPEIVPVLAVSQGAAVIEKHFCLSRSDPGLDDPIALPPELFSRMVKAVRHAETLTSNEIFEEIALDRGEKIVTDVLGTGAKTLAPSELANYGRTNRSLHALRDIAEGEIIAADNIGVLRTEKVLRPGLPPSWEPLVAGRKARNPIPAGEGIRFEDI